VQDLTGAEHLNICRCEFLVKPEGAAHQNIKIIIPGSLSKHHI